MADLSKLSDADFQALQAGNLRGMSDAGFALLLQATPEAIGPAGVAEVRAQGQREQRQRERAEADPTRGMSTPALVAAGAGKSVADTGRAIHQALGKISSADVDEARALDRPLMETTAGRVGNIAGTAAQSIPIAMLPGANTALGAAMYGGAFNAAQPVGTADDDNVMKRAMRGALTGGATVGGGNALTWLLDPKPAAAAGMLYAAGDRSLTPGQTLGGAAKRIEDAATSLPITGDVIKSAQRRGVEGFNVAVANRALQHIGQSVPQGVQAGRQLVEHVERTIGDVYDDVLARVGSVQRDAAFAAEIGALRGAVKRSVMPKQVQAQFETAIRNQIDGKFQGRAVMTAQTFKDAESELGRLAAKYAGDASVDKQLLGDALQEAQAALRRLLVRAAGPGLADEAKGANAAWAEFKRLQRAAGAQGSSDGVFSAEQYRAAVRALDKSKDKGAFARGSALGEDFAEAGVSALGRTVPDSGTPLRTLVTQPGTGAVSALLTGVPVGALYNQPAMNALQWLALTKRPALATRAAAGLQTVTPFVGAGAVASQR